MTVLRPREVLPTNSKPNRPEIEPVTPLQNREPSPLPSPAPVSTIRRSARLASKLAASGDDDSTDARRKRKLDVTAGSSVPESVEVGGNSSGRSGKKPTKKNSEEYKMEVEVLNTDLVRNDKGKGLMIDLNVEASGDDMEVDMDVDSDSGEVGRRFSRQEKGKGILVEDPVVHNVVPVPEPEPETEVYNVVDLELEIGLERTGDVGIRRMAQFRSIARENAARFARSQNQREVEGLVTENVEREIDDWPGPFSTAMKIIKDRAAKMSRPQSKKGGGEASIIKWSPRNGHGPVRSTILVPSLRELSLKILVQNADAITSLDSVPDPLRHKLCQMLCDSEGMNSHFLDLLVKDCPTEIRLRNCSWLTEDEFTKCFEGCDTGRLMVLQLDRCGRCMADYLLFSTFGRSINCMPSLTTLSITGACRLSDAGLQAIVSSSPALRYINLSQCSLLTSTSIDVLADSLGLVLQELYINDCQSIDATSVLPALKKLEGLEALSMAGIETVNDDFVREFVTARGGNLKELILVECVKLTDFSLKAIAENCPNLRTLDISNLCKLTDYAIGYLANGCHGIQTLKLCRNVFSDEAIAAFLETSGESLKDLSLNSVKKVADNTALSIGKCGRNLINLDLSFCRDLTNEAVGYIVDNCSTLRMLKLFGNTQITNVFLDGHSNPDVKIIGYKMSPVLKDIKVPDPEDVPSHYFSVLSSL